MCCYAYQSKVFCVVLKKIQTISQTRVESRIKLCNEPALNTVSKKLDPFVAKIIKVFGYRVKKATLITKIMPYAA